MIGFSLKGTPMRFASRLILALSLMTFGFGAGCYPASTTPPNPTTNPTTQPAPKPDKVTEIATTVGNVAGTVAAVSPPGSPVQGGAAIVAALSGLVIAGNDILKKIFKKPPPAN
jgi:hypothetical protein